MPRISSATKRRAEPALVYPDGHRDDAELWATILGDDVLPTDSFLVDMRDAEWQEGDHPRDDDGKFTGTGGGTESGGVEPTRSGSTVAMAHLLEAISRPDGGFTVQPLTGDVPFGPGHFAVSIARGRERELAVSAVTAGELADFINSNSSAWTDPSTYFGGWHDPESHKVFLDISRVVTSPADARQLALDNDQIAYFDFGAGSSVPVGGRHAQA